jgi:hypothetical protein
MEGCYNTWEPPLLYVMSHLKGILITLALCIALAVIWETVIFVMKVLRTKRNKRKS